MNKYKEVRERAIQRLKDAGIWDDVKFMHLGEFTNAPIRSKWWKFKCWVKSLFKRAEDSE